MPVPGLFDGTPEGFADGEAMTTGLTDAELKTVLRCLEEARAVELPITGNRERGLDRQALDTTQHSGGAGAMAIEPYLLPTL
ncbi:MAG TPA: hypothetical protein VGV37_25270 [Aliidongia sp.]|uniref:hypothetical protein n=1 Tax=Aliidongia sp. TaxID=1914230 RepID=UPI002DDDB03F|nr:hypothetical protein [Aliidongia sp.]HEV2677867.1 hypothetical protein [Aliidongia sp.]